MNNHNRYKPQISSAKPKSGNLLLTNDEDHRDISKRNDNKIHDGHKGHPETAIKRVISLDKQVSKKLFICSEMDVGFISGTWKRKILLLCEYSGHEILWLILISLCLFLYRRDPTLWPVHQNLAIAFVLDIVIIVCLKMLCQRQRPATNKADMHVLASVDNYSFPSGHASRITVLACVLLHHPFIPRYGHIYLLCWVVVVSLSRTLAGRHYLGDVICGNLIGLLEYFVCKAFLWTS